MPQKRNLPRKETKAEPYLLEHPGLIGFTHAGEKTLNCRGAGQTWTGQQ